MRITKLDAIKSLCPTVDLTVENDSTITFWSDDSVKKPTDSEINAELTKLETEYKNKKYQRDRAAEYPTLQDQLDMQYWDKKNGTTTWVDAIAKVKSDNPKP